MFKKLLLCIVLSIMVIGVAGCAKEEEGPNPPVQEGEIIYTEVEDPVCEKSIDKRNAPPSVEYKGKTYYFCSAHCKEAFLKNPGKYIK